MDRLTKYSNKTYHENGVCCTHFRSEECNALGGECAHGCKWEEMAWERLAAYEDTWMAPEQIIKMRNALAYIFEDADRIVDLAIADAEGRVLVLPTREQEVARENEKRLHYVKLMADAALERMKNG